MGNLTSGGCGCASEATEFEPFRETGGEVRVLIVGMDYQYSKGNELTGIKDAKYMRRICEQADVEDVTFITDEGGPESEDFPTAGYLKEVMRDIGSRCTKDDFFVFFYAGHGENVPDQPPLDEADGLDEALVTPGPNGEIGDPKHMFIDDDFAHCIEKFFNHHTRILLLFDCCHSATMADVDTYRWNRARRIVSISACQDDEESADTGHGGILTISMDKAMGELSMSRGAEEYSVQSLFDLVVGYAGSISREQELHIQSHGCAPELMPWPLPRAWWDTAKGRDPARFFQKRLGLVS